MIYRILLVTLLAALVACKGEAKTSDKSLREMDIKQVRAALAEEGQKVVMVDARPPEQFDAGHLPGAINVFLPEVRAGDGRLQAADRVIVYGAGWQDPLAPATAKRLMALKYSNVYLFRGGMEVWERGGQATQPAAPSGRHP